MERRAKNPGRRFQILAVLDRRHPAPRPPGWTSSAVAAACGIAPPTAHHLVTRLLKNGLVEAEELVRDLDFRRKLKTGGSMSGTIPVRTLVWGLTAKGAARLAYKGGHARWCPMCAARR
jgi:hypothetical protein